MDWLKTALAAEAPQTGGTPGGQQTIQPPAPVAQEGAQQDPQDVSPIKPAPTPTTEQNAAKGKQQNDKMGHMMQVSLPIAAQESLGKLNQSLDDMSESLSKNSSLDLQPQAARALAVEIMAEWLGASRSGPVSQLAPKISGSKRIQALLETMF